MRGTNREIQKSKIFNSNYQVANLQVMTMVFSPSQTGLSDMIFACVVMSCGDSCGSSFG